MVKISNGVYYNFGNIKIQEILFTLLSPTSGTDLSLIYSFTFTISADTNRTVGHNIQQAVSPYTNRQNKNIDVKTTPQEYSIFYKGLANESAFCRFFVGDINGTVTVGNMTMTEYDNYPINPVYALIWTSPSYGPSYIRNDTGSFLTMSQNPKIKMLEYKSLQLKGLTLRGVKVGQ